MLMLIVNRIFQALIVVLVVLAVSFMMFRHLGDPVATMLGEQGTVESQAQLREQLGLNDPVLVQFGHFVERAVHGNFGVSYRNSIPVSELIAERFPATMELSICGMLLALIVGIPLGVASALRPRSRLSVSIQFLSTLGIALPVFSVGIILILVFAVNLGILPASGRGEVVAFGWWTTGLLTRSGLEALILPSIALSVFQLALVIRLIRTELLEVLRADYIRFARARGLSNAMVNFRYALSSALVPVVTVMGMQFGSLIAFTIVVESVFQWPGMGSLFLQAVQFGDVPVMSAYLALVALIFVVVNFLVDVSYAYLDPRTRKTGSKTT